MPLGSPLHRLISAPEMRGRKVGPPLRSPFLSMSIESTPIPEFLSWPKNVCLPPPHTGPHLKYRILIHTQTLPNLTFSLPPQSSSLLCPSQEMAPQPSCSGQNSVAHQRCCSPAVQAVPISLLTGPQGQCIPCHVGSCCGPQFRVVWPTSTPLGSPITLMEHLLFYLTHLPLGSSRAHSLPYSTFGSDTTSTEAAFWTLKLGKAPLNPSFP